MNRTYFEFLFITTIKKRPVWITWLIFLLTISTFLITVPAVSGANTLQIWANTTMTICQSFVGMAAALFTAILAIHTFKDGLEDGTELIVISKPISRHKIVLTKFIVFATLCLLVNLSSIIITIFTIFIPSTETKFYWQLILSTFIGNIISFGVFGSIACLLTLRFAKVGVIVCNLMISLITIIYQCLTLFCFNTPAKSMLDHGMKAPSYILIDRNASTGEYKETEVVRFDTLATNVYITIDDNYNVIKNEHANTSTNWQEMSKYWTDEICKNNPSTILNWTDLASQISLTYLTVGLDQYAHRQSNRMFGISRFHNYKLTSPASPEITSGVENKKTLNWAYINFFHEELPDGSVFFKPKAISFPGIAPLGSTRLRGYGDKIPVGHYVKAGEILSTKDIFFEADQWRKYLQPFELMYQNIFDYQLYNPLPESTLLHQYVLRPRAWCLSPKNLGIYYTLIWGCMTGKVNTLTDIPHCEAFTKLSTIKASDLDVNSVDDINERFIQFKNYVSLRAIKEQMDIFNTPISKGTIGELEFNARKAVLDDPDYQDFLYWLAVKPKEDSWYAVQDEESISLLPYIQANTTVPFFDLINKTSDKIYETIKDANMLDSVKQDIMANTTTAKMFKTASMFEMCADVNEEFLFDSIEKPTRSTEHRGRAYNVSSGWYSYLDTLESAIGINGERCVGQNMQWFFYETTDVMNFWTFTIIWFAITIGLFSAGAIVYNKYDVK